MKKSVLALLLLSSSWAFAAKPKPNPADYPLTLQVTCSFVTSTGAGKYGYTEVHLGAMLDGKLVELTNAPAFFPIVPGAYAMRLMKDRSANKYELNQIYELLLPDGKLQTYELSGIGRNVCAAPAS
jgi:hypothetical protein